MSSNHHAQPIGQTLEGQRFRPSTPEECRYAVDLAFDYRGDVSIELGSGEILEGYVYDRNDTLPEPYLKVFPKDGPGTRSLSYADIVSIFFSGEDTAFGKSWEEWANKMQKVSAKKEP